jgi:hypothetical protein
MKLTEQQLRGVIQQVIAEAPKKKTPARRRKPGGGRAALGFSIPEDSSDYGGPFKSVGTNRRFDDLYRKLVNTLRELRDVHGMDPQRIVDQAVATLGREHTSGSV